jgi:uncharacterized membrane protein
MKQLLAFLVFVLVITSCSIERRHYLPGYHVEWQVASGELRVANGEWRATNGKWPAASEASTLESTAVGQPPNNVLNESENSVVASSSNKIAFASTSKSAAKPRATRHSTFVISHSSLVIRHSPLPLDTLKKPFKPQPQYREVDPIGKYAVYTVFVGVALQKLAGMLTWFEVAVPLSFGPAIFIPAVIVALVGLGLSAYSAYRVRKYPEKYKKSEWGKAALAILGWQVLMSALFAWLLL